MKIIFLHGWHSLPGGVKPTYLRDTGHEVVNPALNEDDFAAAVRIAQAEYDQHQPDVIVGSSRGGAVAMNINSGSTPLVLLCPAWKRGGAATTVKRQTTILHSRNDDVIPFSDSEALVTNSGLPPESLIETGCDHRLADAESLEAILEACRPLHASMHQTGTGVTNGVMMSPEGVAASCLLHSTMGLRTGKCYWNCLKVLNTERRFKDAMYVEGIAVKPGKSIHAHGWIGLGDEIIDVTQPTEGLVYYPVLCFRGIAMLCLAADCQLEDIGSHDNLPIYKRFGANGERCSRFRMALTHALRDFGACTPFDPTADL